MPTLREAAGVQQAAPAGTSATTIINASGVNFRYRDLASLTITTPNAAASVITVSDGTKTVLVLNYPNAAAAPASALQIAFEPPLQQSGNGNAAWTFTPSVNASGYNVTAQYVER
jgi:hypothetical protein